MENTTNVPNELLIEAHKEACDKLKKKIEEVNPELFKPKFKVGDWMLFDGSFQSLHRIASYNGTGGYDDLGNYREFSYHKYRLATPSEIESHLIKEAEKRGYNKDNFKCIFGFTIELKGDSKFFYEKSDDTLWFGKERYGANCCYKQGKWATIIPQEEVLTLEERVKRLEEKLSK